MAFFDRISNTISAAGKDGLSKAKELKDTAKLTLDIKEREGAIQRMYRELGKAYYQQHKDDAAPDYEQIFAIKAAFEEIGELKANIDEIRGIKRCPSCGAVVHIDSKYCACCGEKIEEEVECEVVEDDEEEIFEEAVVEPVEEVVEAAEEAVEEATEEVVEEVKEAAEGCGCCCNE